jgi:hypothetical protein
MTYEMRCKIRSFKVGQRIETMLDGNEVTGVLMSINGQYGKLMNKWGRFTVNLLYAKQLIEEPAG